MLKECFCRHIYCAQLGTSWDAIVVASRVVSNRESRYPRKLALQITTELFVAQKRVKTQYLDRDVSKFVVGTPVRKSKY